ncbi:MAG: gamma-glutamyl-gamma-aminobutyrate hydrolase family protein [Rhizobacter sp.]|nr:gamma-glutamyl-gamma-aminobutyrate hydrolase family protein [Chlorobiales bacterium]
MKPLTVAVTACEKGLENYTGWLQSGSRFGYDVRCVVLNYGGEDKNKLRTENLEKLRACDAIVFTGGWDVEPERFGLNLTGDEKKKLRVESTPERDDMEWILAEKSFAENLPLLGICRGLQFINVVRGGSLILDIEQQVEAAANHEKVSAEDSRYHAVTLEKKSRLREMLGAETETMVSSRHHQSADKIGKGLRAVGASPDGVIEAIESVSDDESIFLVQWHPERMWSEQSREASRNNAFSENLLKGFLETVWRHKSARSANLSTAK